MSEKLKPHVWPCLYGKLLVVKIIKNRWISQSKQQVAESFDGALQQPGVSYTPGLGGKGSVTFLGDTHMESHPKTETFHSPSCWFVGIDFIDFYFMDHDHP